MIWLSTSAKLRCTCSWVLEPTESTRFIEADLLKFDQEWALHMPDNTVIDEWVEADIAVEKAQEKVDECVEVVRNLKASQRICLQHDPHAARTSRCYQSCDHDLWALKFREIGKENKKAEKFLKAAKDELSMAKQIYNRTKEAAWEGVGQGPFAMRFEAFLKSLKISRQKYFGGTFVGPDLDIIFRDPENVAALASLLKCSREEKTMWR